MQIFGKGHIGEIFVWNVKIVRMGTPVACLGKKKILVTGLTWIY